MKRKYLLTLLLLLGAGSVICVYAIGKQRICKFPAPVKSIAKSEDSLREGDIIFQTNTSGQGLAIQLATHSKYTHVGVLFLHDSEWMVYEAVEPVQMISLKAFKERGDSGKFVIKRLGAGQSLTGPQLALMKTYVTRQLGKHYDMHFAWDDSRMYCSELVWKCYNSAALNIGTLRKLKDFDLSAPLVRKIMSDRYGDKIPYTQTVVSPGDIFDNPALVVVSEN